MEPCLFRHGKSPRPSGSTAILSLQWSHVFSDMVSHPGPGGCKERHRLQWSHVFSDMVRQSLSKAGQDLSLLQWSHVFSDMVSAYYLLQMGNVNPLQWSHVFSDMVSDEVVCEGSCRVGYASMEPCLFRHGKGLGVSLIAAYTMRGFNGAMSFQTW